LNTFHGLGFLASSHSELTFEIMNPFLDNLVGLLG